MRVDTVRFSRMAMRLTAVVSWIVVLFSIAGLAQAARVRNPQLRDLDGHALAPFAPGARVNVVFFVATDCPISNSYAPVIQRVCREYGPRGVECSLIYEDVDIHPATGALDRAVRQHLQEYGYTGFRAIVDRDRAAASHAKASVTPQVFVIDRAGEARYRGRID